MDKPRILIVDDEIDISEILKFNLSNAGFEVECAESAEEALGMNPDSYDLILLDVMMEGMSGFRMAEIVRKELKSEVPIIFLTARSAENDLLTGFSAGGDDYIGKPFSIHEVIARIRAVLKRSTEKREDKKDEIVEGNLRITLANKMVYIDGNAIVFSKKEFEILYLLVSNKGRIFSREEIIRELWKESPYVLDRTVDVHVARIRSKLGTYKSYITNRSGYGYSFMPDK